MRDIILGNLPRFRNNEYLRRNNQDTNDIIKGILETHAIYRPDYDKIANFFDDENPKKIGKKIFDFLKENVKYYVEPESKQTLKSPTAIVATGRTTGADCKSYAMFASGILDALNRQGKNIPFCYRFASYRMFDKTPGHVFTVINPGTSNEIWVDPVLNKFNEKKQYYFAKDKKPMALYSINGVGKINLKAAANKVKNVVIKVGAAPARNAFLVLVKLNFRSLAKNIDKALQKNADKVKRFWSSAGGDTNVLLRAVEQGKKKKRLGGIGVVVATGTAASVAAASPLLVKIASLLKSIGIDPEQVAEAAMTVAKTKAQEAVAKISEKAEAQQIATDQQIAEDTGTTVQEVESANGQTVTSAAKKWIIPAAIGVGAILLLSKKRK